jgi:hypothetical protein
MIFLQRHSNEKDIKKGTGIYSEANPEYRKSFNETMDRARKMKPDTILAQRKWVIKAIRFQGKTPELVARAAALRTAASEEINR